MLFFFFKQKTAYEMRIRDWSSDVCSSDLLIEFEGDHILGTLGVALGNNASLMYHEDAAGAVPCRIVSAVSAWRIDRKSVVEGKSVSVRVALGGRRIIKKKKITYSHLG